MTKIPLWKNLLNSWWVRKRRAQIATAYLFFSSLPPEEHLNNPIKCFGFDEVKRNILTMPLNDSWSMHQVDVVQFLCIDPHDLESLWFQSKSLYSWQIAFYLISISKHVFHKNIIFLNVLLLYMFLIKRCEGISYSCTVSTLFVLIETCNSTTFPAALGTGVLPKS